MVLDTTKKKKIYQYDTTYTPSNIDIFSTLFSDGAIANGVYQELLCEKIRKLTDCKYVFLTNSGTAALHIALLSLDTSSNDQVILPSYLCQDVLNSILYTGAKPVFVDINSNNYSLDISHTISKISSITKAIIVPYLYGDIFSLDELKKYGIPIIEDLAHCFGGSINGQKLGSIGDIGMTSFGRGKFVDGGSGGAIFTNNSKIAEKIKILLTPTTNNYKINFNYNLPNIIAAIICEKLSFIDRDISKRKKIAQKYIDKISQIDKVHIRYKSNQDSFFYRFFLDVDIDKKKFIENMEDEDVVCGVGINHPLHTAYGYDYDLPNTKIASKKSIGLPTRPNLTDEEIESIIKAIKDVL